MNDGEELLPKQDNIKELTQTITEYETIIKMREAELDQANEMNFCLIEMSKCFEQEKDFWKSMFYDIQNSTSWKATRGLRFISSLFRRRR